MNVKDDLNQMHWLFLKPGLDSFLIGHFMTSMISKPRENKTADKWQETVYENSATNRGDVEFDSRSGQHVFLSYGTCVETHVYTLSVDLFSFENLAGSKN